MRYTRKNLCMRVYRYVKMSRCLCELPHKCLRLGLLSTLFLVPLLPLTPHAPMHPYTPTLSLYSLTLCTLSGYPVRWKETWKDVWSHIHWMIEIHLTTNNSDRGSVWRPGGNQLYGTFNRIDWSVVISKFNLWGRRYTDCQSKSLVSAFLKTFGFE